MRYSTLRPCSLIAFASDAYPEADRLWCRWLWQGYGVIRDVLQNHLTQMLVLLKMDLPPLPLSDVYGSHTHRTATLKTLRLHGQDADTEGSSASHLQDFKMIE